MNFPLLISLTLTLCCGVFNITRQLQMLQQNSYFPSRYSGWLKDNIPFSQVFAFFVSSVLFCFELYAVLIAFCVSALGFSIYFCIANQKKSIKKLSVTARVKRQFSAVIIIYLSLLALYIIFSNSLTGGICAAVILMLGFISPLSVYICWAVTAPVEKIFAKHYINDAKKILKNYNNLKVIGIIILKVLPTPSSLST